MRIFGPFCGGGFIFLEFSGVRNTKSLVSFVIIALVTMTTKLCQKYPRVRQQQPNQVRVGLLNVHHQGRPAHACFARASAGLPSIEVGRTVCPAAAAGRPAPERAKHAWAERPQQRAFGKLACTRLGCRCRQRRHPERSFVNIVPKLSDAKYFEHVKYLKHEEGGTDDRDRRTVLDFIGTVFIGPRF